MTRYAWPPARLGPFERGARRRRGNPPVAATIAGAVLALLAGGCDSSSPDRESSERAYAVVGDEAWSLQEAVDPPEDDPFASLERPPVAWRSAHVRTIGNEGQRVRLSGHAATIDDTDAALGALGFDFEPIALDGWEGVGGTAPADPTGPAIVLLDNGSTTFMLLSYELSVEELATFAAAVDAVDQAAWIDEGGVVR